MNTNKHFVRQRLLVLAVLLPMALLTRASVVLNATNFPDAVFRSYISEVTGVSEGGTLTDAILSKVYRSLARRHSPQTVLKNIRKMLGMPLGVVKSYLIQKVVHL